MFTNRLPQLQNRSRFAQQADEPAPGAFVAFPLLCGGVCPNLQSHGGLTAACVSGNHCYFFGVKARQYIIQFGARQANTMLFARRQELLDTDPVDCIFGENWPGTVSDR